MTTLNSREHKLRQAANRIDLSANKGPEGWEITSLYTGYVFDKAMTLDQAEALVKREAQALGAMDEQGKWIKEE